MRRTGKKPAGKGGLMRGEQFFYLPDAKCRRTKKLLRVDRNAPVVRKQVYYLFK